MIQIFEDGSDWCALEGINLQEGIAGFGTTQAQALRDLANGIEEQDYKLFSDR